MMYERHASNRQEQSTDDLLDRIEQAISGARTVPFSNNCMVDREELLVLVGMIRDTLPPELKQARWLLAQNRQLIAEARKEAEQMIRDAETRMAAMIDENEITQQARLQARQTVEAANHSAQQIRMGALEYTKKHLADLEERLTAMLVAIQKDSRTLK